MSWPRSRRPRKKGTAKVGNYNDAVQWVATIEKRAIAALVDVPFDEKDILRWLLPAEAIAALKGAHQYAQHQYTSFSLETAHGNLMFKIDMDLEGLNMLVPNPAAVKADPEYTPVVLRVVQDCKAIVDKCDKVRKLISVFSNWSPNAVAAVAPWMKAISGNIPLAEAGGRYQTPDNLAEHVQAIREAQEIVAGLLLTPDNIEVKDKGKMSIMFQESGSDARSWRYSASQEFVLVP